MNSRVFKLATLVIATGHLATIYGMDTKASADSKLTTDTQQSSIVTIHVPQAYGATVTLDLNDTETLTQSSFAELIDAQHKRGDTLIIARVTSQASPSSPAFVHYFDAHSFNRYITGKEYPYNVITNNERQLLDSSGQPLKNFYNKLPITGVQYFNYDPKQPTKGFTFLCSYTDLMAENQGGHWRLKFYANQNHDAVEKNRALLSLGAAYFYGRYGLEENYAKAREYLISAVKQSANSDVPEDTFKLLSILGACYRIGYLVEKDYNVARECLIPIAERSTDLQLQFEALYDLSKIYKEGGHGVEKNSDKVLEYLEPAVEALERLNIISQIDEALVDC